MKTLLVGYTAADLYDKDRRHGGATAGWLDGDVTCHTLDIYQRHAIEKAHHLRAICAPHLPAGPWDLVRFRTGPKVMSGELALDLLQEIHLLRPAKFELDFVGRERDRNDLLGKIKDDPGRIRSFRAEWPASVPGGPKLTFASYPGCFCHRRLDEGGLALAEVVVRELASADPQPRDTPAPRLLDMGCGCGLVGLLVATALANPNTQPAANPNTQTPTNPNTSSPIPRLVMVDSHTRAVEAATENAARLGVEAEVILSDNGTPARMDGLFDVFVGNPPYYSDYRIADVFLETARRALRPGGVAYTVCKNAAGLEPVQRRYFPDVEIIRRRGYSVLKSVKS